MNTINLRAIPEQSSHVQHAAATPHRLAYQSLSATPAHKNSPGVMMMTGFRSDMTGSKASALHDWAEKNGYAYLRFDYSGHGQSDGKFTDGSIGQWLKDALYMLDQHTTGKQILVGSSMSGWIMLHVAMLRPERVAGLVGIASAPDFTEELIWNVISENTRDKLMKDGLFYEPPVYDSEPTPITRHLIEDGRKYLLLERDSLPIRCPVRLIHGVNDVDVPCHYSQKILEKIDSDDVQLTFIKDGDHRLSRPQDIEMIKNTLESLMKPC